MSRECMVCHGHLGETENGKDGISHGCCLSCAKAKYPEAYDYMRHQEAMRRGRESMKTYVATLDSAPLYPVTVR